MAKIICSKCIFFFVTHDKNRPWGCKKFNFKSKALPNHSILMSTGMECAYHTLRKNVFTSKRF